jgi:hypothetical protein
VQQHLQRQVWLETALRSAFVQEQALREEHAAKQSSWVDHAAGLRDTLSKQARLLSLRQVSMLTGYRQGGGGSASVAYARDHNPGASVSCCCACGGG